MRERVLPMKFRSTVPSHVSLRDSLPLGSVRIILLLASRCNYLPNDSPVS